MFRIRLKAIALISFLAVIGSAIWKKALSISLCGLLGLNSLLCSANLSDRPANAAIPPATAESTVMPETIGDIPRIRKPQVDINLQQTLPEDFQVSSQMPFSSGRREILLVSPSTGTEQQYTVNLPGRSFQMYQMKLKNVGAIATSNLPPTARHIVENTQDQNIREFEIDFEDNRASEVVLADGTRGELRPDRASIKSPNGEVLETIELSQVSQGNRRGFASSKFVSKPQEPGDRADASLLASESNCRNTVGVTLGNFSQRMTTIGNQLVLSQVPSTRTVGLALSFASAALKNNAKSTQSIQEVTCEPPVQCDERRVSGASEIRSDLFQIPAAIDRQVTLEYEFFEIPDTIELNYDGNQIFADGPKSGLNQQSFRLPDTAEYVGVRLTGNTDPGTRWWYQISCTGTAIVEHPCGDDEIQVSYDTTSEDYHSYIVENTICFANHRCNKNFVFEVMLSNKQFIAPDHNSTEKVKHCETTDLDLPGLWFTDTIRTTVNAEQYSITNYTKKNHVLHPGKITRKIIQKNNKIYILTVGEGTGMFPSLNECLSECVWGKVDKKLKNKVTEILQISSQ